VVHLTHPGALRRVSATTTLAATSAASRSCFARLSGSTGGEEGAARHIRDTETPSSGARDGLQVTITTT
jgi:hypothetical protein